MRFLELKDVIFLLRSEVERAGGQTAWAKKTGVDRVTINRALNDKQPPTKKIIRALKLRMVFVPKRKSGSGSVQHRLGE
jgi:DNA-binding phage protein